MNKLELIEKKIELLNKNLNDLKKLFISLKEETNTTQNIDEVNDKYEPKDLINDFDKLYDLFLQNKQNEIKDFLKLRPKKYLIEFSLANNLGIEKSKISKNTVFKELLSWMMQRKEISK
ncbi:MAG: hypothetical protein K8F60_06945 [Melioribacteraceae bacterium]|nr:hypothetical protein [Melioribacteraceae bacterium]